MKKNRDLEFLFEIGGLRHIDRSWRQFLGIPFANVSEHTFRVMYIALILASRNPRKQAIDFSLLIRMALVHDITESRTGDVNYLSRQYVKRHEEDAIKDMLKDTSLDEWLREAWGRYEARDSYEALLVKDADNIDVDLELKEQEALGNTAIGLAKKEMRKHVRDTKLNTEEAKQLWDEIQTANPHDWHLNANNRFNSGDWKK